MPRIPLPQPGGVLTQPAPRVGGFGAGNAAMQGALANAGGMLQAVGQDMQRRQDKQQADQDAAAARWDAARAQEAAALKKAADDAQRFTVLTGVEDGLRDLQDQHTQGIIDGTIPKEKAQQTYRDAAAKLVEKAGQELGDFLDRDLQVAHMARSAERGADLIGRAVDTKNRQDVSAGLGKTLEYLQRQYPSNPQGTTAQAMAVIEQLGPHSTLKPEQLADLGQKWKEQTQFTAGFEAVSAGRDSLPQLAVAEKVIAALPDLDPQKRAQLQDRVLAYRLSIEQRNQARADAAAREAERRLKLAEASFNTFQALADKGTVLSPDYIDRTLLDTAGTPYQQGIKMLAQQARETGGLARQPLAVQQATLDQVNAAIAQQGRSPALDKRKEQVEKVLRGSEVDLKNDPLRAGLERGVIDAIQPLDMSGGALGLVKQLQARAPMADRVSQWAGRPVSPLTSDEANTIRQQLDTLPATEKAGWVAGVAAAIGPQAAQGLADQIGGRDRALSLAFSVAAEKTTAGRYTSEILLKGAAAKKDGSSTKGDKAAPDVRESQWSGHFAQQLAGVFPNEQTSGQVREAAILISHGLAAEAGGKLSAADMDRALRLAIGGDLVEHAGRMLPLPAGVDEDMLAKRLRSISAAELAPQTPGGVVLAGGQQIPVADFLAKLPAQPLMPASKGKYSILVGGRPVVNSQGRVIVIGVQ